MAILVALSPAERDELERAAAEASLCARMVLAHVDGSPSFEPDPEELAWVSYFLASRQKGTLILSRKMLPRLEACPSCGAPKYVEFAFGIGETVSTSPGPRNALGHAGDENHAWIILMLCLACGHEGQCVVDTGDPLYA